jgi:hypothetical protein
MGAPALTRQVHRALCIMATAQRPCARDAERLSHTVRGNKWLRVMPRMLAVLLKQVGALIGGA